MDTLVWLDSPGAIEQHLRHAIPSHDLEDSGVRFILCDPDNQVMLHAQVGDREGDDDDDDDDYGREAVPDDGLGGGPEATITRFITQMAEHGIIDGVLVALTRPGRPTLTEADRTCFRAAHAVCAEQAVRLLGVHVVTPRGQRAVLLDDAL